MSILETKDLRKIYGSGENEVRALDGVSISIEEGEFVAVVGTSGSGKSTLLNMLGGLDRPTSGSVTIRGKELLRMKDEELTIFRRRNIGFVFQNYNLLPVLNVYENIVYPIEIDGGRTDTDFVKEIIHALGLQKKLRNIRCIDEILEQVRRNTGLSITETQVERILQGKSCSMPAEVVSLIEKQGRLYIEKILYAITEAGFDLRAVPSVFMGGGAAIFQHRVSTQNRLCRPIYLTDIHANAAGYERIVGQMRAL